MNSAFLPMNSRRVTCLLWALMVRACSPFSKSHTLTVLSPPALARSLPSAIQPTSRTWCVCPSKDLTNLPAGSSQTLTNLSADPVASILLSGLNAMPYTVSLWPFLISVICFQVADFEDLDFAFHGRLAAGDGKELAVERKGDGDDGISEAGDAADGAGRSGCPRWRFPGSCRRRAICRRASRPWNRPGRDGPP